MFSNIKIGQDLFLEFHSKRQLIILLGEADDANLEDFDFYKYIIIV